MWGVMSLGVFAFLAAVMIWATRFFHAKSDALLAKEAEDSAAVGH